jgi:hypothetical protein
MSNLSNLYPRITRVPLNQRKIWFDKLQTAATLQDLIDFKLGGIKPWRKFVFFGTSETLARYYSTAGREGLGLALSDAEHGFHKSNPNTTADDLAMYWFGEVTIPGTATPTANKIKKEISKAAKIHILSSNLLSIKANNNFTANPALWDKIFAKKIVTSYQLSGTRTWVYSAWIPFHWITTIGNPKVIIGDSPEQIAKKAENNPLNTDFGIHVGNHSMVKPFSGPDPDNPTETRTGSVREVLIRGGDLASYAAVVGRVLSVLDNRIRHYDIKFDRPFDAKILANQFSILEQKVRQYIEAAGTTWDPTKIIKFYFDMDYSTDSVVIMGFFPPGTKPNANDALKTIDRAYFTPQINSLIFSATALYNKYINSFALRTDAFRGLISADEVRHFLNTYIYPKPSLVAAAFTRGIVEKFILGDARLLDDEYFKNYNVSAEDMPFAFKQNMDEQVSRQYEVIGDFLGDKWLRGEFKEINDFEDLYKQLLDQIDIAEVVAIAVKCLFKMLPIEDTMDKICKPVLDSFDEHKADIIAALEKMEDDTIAKDLAKELANLYFKELDDTLDTAAETVYEFATNLGSFAKESNDVVTWWSASKIQSWIKTIDGQIRLLLKGYIKLNEDISSYGERIKPLEDAHTKLDKRMEPFKALGNIPPNQATLLKDYMHEIAEIKAERNKRIEVQKNITDQLRLYNYLVPIVYPEGISSPTTTSNDSVNKANNSLNILKTQLEQDINASGFTYVAMELINVNPYISTAEQESLFQQIFTKRWVVPPSEETKQRWTTGPSQQNSITNLKAFGDQTQNGFFNNTAIHSFSNKASGNSLILINKVHFAPFSQQYPEWAVGADKKKGEFKSALAGPRAIFEYIHYLNTLDSAPTHGDNAEKLFSFGKSVAKAALDKIWDNPKKRYRLCIAIYSTIGSAAYLLYQALADWEGTERFIKDQAAVLGKAIKRRWQLATAFIDYPYMDILGGMVDSLVLLGKNLGRDLILNGIMWVLDQIREACSDEDKIDTPYSPLGVVDLSDYMIASKGAPGAANPGGKKSIRDTSAWKRISYQAPDITSAQFKTILDTVSAAYTIKEMCSLVNGTASVHLYVKAEKILNSIESIKDTQFLKLYATATGIKIFFEALSKDIDPVLCARAIENYEKEKTKLLEICFAKDYSELEKILCKDIPPEECLKRLAVKSQAPRALLERLSGDLNTLSTARPSLDPCENGDTELDPSLKHSSDTVGNSIFGALQTIFESDIARVKDIYLDTAVSFGEISRHNHKVRELQSQSILPEFFQDSDIKNHAVSMSPKTSSDTKVAIKILENVHGQIPSMRFERKPNLVKLGEDTPDSYLHFKKALGLFERTIEFRYNSPQDTKNTNIDVYYKVGEQASDGAPGTPATKLVATYSADKYEFIEKASDRIPEKILFEPSGGIVTTQPSYYTPLKKGIGHFALDPNNDFYLSLLNSIFQDLYATSFKTGLFNKDEFNKLRLKRHAELEHCFFGFMNKTVLNEQMQNLANKLKCYNPSNPAQGPVNIATIKIALDCLIRVITVKELMKSLFVYGIFPTELLHDNEASFYDQFINAEVAESIARHLGTADGSEGTGNIKSAKEAVKIAAYTTNFYDNVVKEFITDVMRIIYQNESITEKEAYSILKNKQIEFVKHLMIQTVSNNLSASVTNVSEYQMAKEALNPANDGEDAYMELQKVSYVDKIQALQNDYFTLWANSFDAAGGVPGDGSPMTGIKWAHAVIGSGIKPSSLPTISRKFNNKYFIEYYDYEALKKQATGWLPQLLQGIDDGIVLEKMIEIKYNHDFASDKVKTDLEVFFLLLGSASIMNSKGARKYLKQALNQTRMIMFFPQLKRIIDSLDLNHDASGALWNKYVKWGKKIVTTGTGESASSKEVDTITTGMLLFQQFYKFNFNEYSKEVKTLLNDVNLRRDVDWSLTGKYYLSDFEHLISSFEYPTGENLTDRSDQEIKNIVHSAYSPSSFKDSPPDGLTHTALSDLYSFFMASDSESSVRKMFKHFFHETWGNTGQTFIQWMTQGAIKNIFNISTVLKLNGYIKSNAEMAASFESDVLFSDVLTANNQKVNSNKYLKTLLEEKMGLVEFKSSLGKTSKSKQDYICFPVFEVKEAIPDHLTWFDFFLNIDKNKYLLDSFYKTLGTTNLNWEVNDILFPSNVGRNDVFDYLYRFKNAAGVDINQTKKKFVTRYASSYAWSIREHVITKEEILAHVALGAAAKKIGSTGLWFSNPAFGYYDEEKPYNGAFAYLTDASLASLTGDHEYFVTPGSGELNDVGKESLPLANTGYVPKGLWSDGNLIDPIEGTYSWSHEGYQGPRRVAVGEWDVKDTQTGKVVAKGAKKFIAVRETIFGPDGPNDTETGGYSVDLGFWMLGPGHYTGEWAKLMRERSAVLTKKYAGATFNPRYGFGGIGVWEDVFGTGASKFGNFGLFRAWKSPDPISWMAGFGVANSKKDDNLWHWEPHLNGAKMWLPERGEYGHRKLWAGHPWTKFGSKGKYGWYSGNENKITYSSKTVYDSDGNPHTVKVKHVGWDDLQHYHEDRPRKEGDHYGHPSGAKTGKFATPFTGSAPGKKSNDLGVFLPDQHNTGGFTWHSGPAYGGLAASTKQIEEIDTGTAHIPNAYEMFASILNAKTAGATENPDKVYFNLLLKSFFIKEQTTMIALMHKLLAEQYYPRIETTFDASIAAATKVLMTAVATANGDYAFKTPTNKSDDSGFEFPDVDLGAIAGEILKMFVVSMANTVDPTWKTDYFQPGPFTPFGFAAKALVANPDLFKSSPETATQKHLPPYCKDEVAEATLKEQAEFFNVDVDSEKT